MFNLPPPPGFQGLDADKPLRLYHRRLPHWRQDGATYFITYRLADSLPQAKLRELNAWRTEWERQNPPPRTDTQAEQMARALMEKVEYWLDQGMGSCWLREPRFAILTTEALHYFDNDRYELNTYVVMPNHVHVIVRPLRSDQEVEIILHGWKRHTSRRINKSLGKSGTLWQEESFDRIIRDEEHLYRAIQYIGSNPSKAGLSPNVCPLWVRPEWEQIGWRFENDK